MTHTRIRHASLRRPSGAGGEPPHDALRPETNAVDRVLERALAASPLGGAWVVQPRSGSEGSWTYVRHAAARTPAQGWKLHVSATDIDAEAMLARALPVLLAERSSFKLVTDPGVLRQLNRGALGPSQVGKVVTVYPEDSAQGVRLAERLHAATAGLRGPAVPTDRRLLAGSRVSYRYGDFTGQALRRPTGAVVPAFATPAGELVPDERGTAYRKPDWAIDPFGGGVAADTPPAPGSLVDGRLLVVASLAELPRGAALLAADLATGRRCILKTACADSAVDREGADARDYLRREAAVLASVSGDPRFPRAYRLIEQGGMLMLEMEDFAGERLDQFVARRAALGDLPVEDEVLSIGRLVADALAALHARGFAHRDVKSTNLLLGEDGGIRLIDFGLAHALDAAPRLELGTRGYRAVDGNAVQADVHAAGALLYFLATGAEPALAPYEYSLLDRPVRTMNPAIGAGLATVIERCLAPAAERFASAAALADALAAPVRASVDVPRATRPVVDLGDADGCRAAARRIGDSLCATMRQTEPGVRWVDGDDRLGGTALDLGAGTAGTLLGLAELVSEIGDDAHRAVLMQGASHLAERQAMCPRLPGLYVGEAGIGAALLRCGQVLGEPALIEDAAQRSAWVADQPHRSPDLYVGSAGRLRLHLMLWDETGEPAAIAAAIAAGEALLRAAEHGPVGAVWWTIPPGYEAMSGNAYLGYAHGAAGIADALLDLFEATGREDVLQAVRGAARWLAAHGVHVLRDGRGLHWPSVIGGTPGGAYWCHGAGGIGTFLVRAAESGCVADASVLAHRAGLTVAAATRWLNPTQCHGLAGSIELLLDLYRATGDASWLEQARAFGTLMAAFAIEGGGGLVWPSEAPGAFAPDYLTGYAGVATCLLRLAAPERLPHLLSREGFAPACRVSRAKRG